MKTEKGIKQILNSNIINTEKKEIGRGVLHLTINGKKYEWQQEYIMVLKLDNLTTYLLAMKFSSLVHRILKPGIVV